METSLSLIHHGNFSCKELKFDINLLKSPFVTGYNICSLKLMEAKVFVSDIKEKNRGKNIMENRIGSARDATPFQAANKKN